MLSATVALVALLTATSTPIKYTPELERAFIRSEVETRAIMHQLDPERVLAIMDCESGGEPKSWNHDDPGRYGSRGIFQFQESTFDEAAKRYELPNPDIWNPTHQAKIATWLMAQNKWNLWSCNAKIKYGAVDAPIL